MKRILIALAALALVLLPAASNDATPIQHVVVIDLENHTFNQMLGWLCTNQGRPCLGTTTGVRYNGSVVSLGWAPDVPPDVSHTVAAQTTAINGGLMNGFNHISQCDGATGGNYLNCYSRYGSGGVANLATIAKAYAVSDHTFSDGPVPSWGSHLDLVAGTTDGFTGDNPPGTGLGWGCDSGRDAYWGDPAQLEPACVPQPDGSGPYRPSPVQWVPTIMDELDSAGLSWHIYAAPRSTATPTTPMGYGWAICPSFADCLDTPQALDVSDSNNAVTDLASQSLPAVTFVMPRAGKSEHNGYSVTAGDNWLGSLVGAVQSNPDYASTAIFVTYDDCGCFYDEVPPPPGLGPRVPMVIVSPYARQAFIDPTPASFSSILAFIEHDFGLPALAASDATAYDYAGAFDYSQVPNMTRVAIVRKPISRATRLAVARANHSGDT